MCMSNILGYIYIHTYTNLYLYIYVCIYTYCTYLYVDIYSIMYVWCDLYGNVSPVVVRLLMVSVRTECPVTLLCST